MRVFRILGETFLVCSVPFAGLLAGLQLAGLNPAKRPAKSPAKVHTRTPKFLPASAILVQPRYD